MDNYPAIICNYEPDMCIVDSAVPWIADIANLCHERIILVILLTT